MTQNLPVVFQMNELERMAEAFAKSQMFGAKTKEQALALLLLAHGEGLHPAIAMRDFDVIQGRPSKKAEAMLRSFIGAGGSVEWHQLDDTCADATFSHPQGGSARISWDMKRAKMAGVGGKDMYSKYPRQMLRSRVVSEGCRTVYPASTSGLYVPEEVVQFSGEKDISPTAGALQALPVARQEMLNETAAKMRELYANDQLFEAYTLMENSGLDTDDRVALFSLLDSKLKNALGRLGAAERAQQSGVISPAKHKRLEAIIKESKLNRQGLKDWCALQFNKTHFTELTDDEYKELDAHIASIAPTVPPQASAAAHSPGGAQPPAAGAVPTITEAQEGVILDLLLAAGMEVAHVTNHKDFKLKRLLDLPQARYDELCERLKAKAAK